MASRVRIRRSPLILFASSMVKLNVQNNGGSVCCGDGGIGGHHLCYIGFMDPALPWRAEAGEVCQGECEQVYRSRTT